MPTLPPSPVSSIHSWSFVYLKPAGYAIVAPHRARGPAPGSPEGLRYVTHLWQPRRAALHQSRLAAPKGCATSLTSGNPEGAALHQSPLAAPKGCATSLTSGSHEGLRYFARL